jgi:CheY-like chemotaxis protein
MNSIEVLLIEDEPGDILLMGQALAEEPLPIRIHVAVDGKQAAQMLSEGQFTPDVIVLDLNLPKLSGLGFLEGYGLQVPVVVFTSSSNPQDKKLALALGAKEYVQKPTDLDAYRRLVSQIIRNWALPDANAASAE